MFSLKFSEMKFLSEEHGVLSVFVTL